MKKSKNLLALLGIAVFLFGTFAFTFSKKEEHGLVKWITFEQAVKNCKTKPKPIMVDIY
ncbi:MAG: hypothetical protein IAF38_02815, partial [Bacteroidia bacterium]|nr:hypothetical protein [Bacteroidia bacterium]